MLVVAPEMLVGRIRLKLVTKGTGLLKDSLDLSQTCPITICIVLRLSVTVNLHIFKKEKIERASICVGNLTLAQTQTGHGSDGS
jgi:hypothetical protein